MRRLFTLIFIAGCAGQADRASESAVDAGQVKQMPPDAAPDPDAPVVVQHGAGQIGAACAQGSDCAGGTCLGAPGQPQEGNPRFAGGYCTTAGCKPDSQDGCGADQWCIDGGDVGGICVAMCNKAMDLECARADHVCLGLGSFGGCFSRQAVQCTVTDKMGSGCPAGGLCIKIGFNDYTLGRCETGCDPMQGTCPDGRGCYLITAYNLAFCNTPGKAKLGDGCDCDKCCEPGLACTSNGDGTGRTCRHTCVFATGEGCDAATESCRALKKDPQGNPISTWGGCVPN